MPLPVPSSPTSVKQLPRSSIPTPSKRPVSSGSSSTQQDPPSSPSPISTPSHSSRPSSAPRQSIDVDNSSALQSDTVSTVSDSAKMPPPSVPARAQQTRSSAAGTSISDKQAVGTEPKKGALSRAGTVLRRAAGVRNLKDKEDEKQGVVSKNEPVKSDRTLRSSISGLRASSSSTSKEERGKEKVAVRGLGSTKSRTASSSTVASTSSERNRTSTTTKGATATAIKKEAVGNREKTAASSRRPLSMPGDTSPIGSTSSSTAKKAVPPQPASNTSPSTATVTRHRRNLSTPSSIVAAAAKERPGTSISASTASNASKSRRPPFSTLRQDFGCPPQPPAQTSRRAMPPPPLDSATIHQQTKLLQYTCLYSNSHATYAQYTASATAKLKRRFETLAKEHSRSREQLARRQRLHDLVGLAAVLETPTAGITGKRRDTIRSPEEKIQAFSEAIKKLEALQQNEHRVLASVFGEWIAGYSPLNASQAVDKVGWVAKRGRWIDGLGEDWRRQCLYISRRIESCVKAVECVVAAVVMEEDAGVISVVSERWMEVARGMLEESQGMLQVEQNVVTRERLTLEEVVASIGAKLDLETSTPADEKKPVWA